MARCTVALQGILLVCFAMIGVSFVWNFYRQERLAAMNSMYHSETKNVIKQRAVEQISVDTSNVGNRRIDERTARTLKDEPTPPKVAPKSGANGERTRQVPVDVQVKDTSAKSASANTPQKAELKTGANGEKAKQDVGQQKITSVKPNSANTPQKVAHKTGANGEVKQDVGEGQQKLTSAKSNSANTPEKVSVNTGANVEVKPDVGVVQQQVIKSVKSNSSNTPQNGPLKLGAKEGKKEDERVMAVNRTKLEAKQKGPIQMKADGPSHDPYFIDIEQGVPDLEDLFRRTVIVTAISDNHLGEAKGMIASAQRYMPNTRIVVYDLGLSPGGATKVGKMCNVEVRKFPWDKYPPHVKNIHNYAWKPLIILETVKEFGAIFYGDSSVRFLDSLQILFPYLKQNHGFMQHIHNFNPHNRSGQYHMTHPDTFRELGINRTAYANDVGYTPWISAGRVLHVNSSFIHQNVLGPLVECALRLPCIAPDGAHRGKGNLKGNQHPHRFDSSVLALVVYKYMRGFYHDENNTTEMFDKVCKIERRFFGFKGLKFEPKCDTLK